MSESECFGVFFVSLFFFSPYLPLFRDRRKQQNNKKTNCNPRPKSNRKSRESRFYKRASAREARAREDKGVPKEKRFQL